MKTKCIDELTNGREMKLCWKESERGWNMKSVSVINFGEMKNSEKRPNISALSTTVNTLPAQKLEPGTPVVITHSLPN